MKSILKQISLSHFRSYGRKTFAFSSEVTIIVGPNTAGKTNVLEAIYLLSSGYSFRAENEREMIAYGQEVAHVKGVIDGTVVDTLEVVITAGQVMGKKTPHKKRLVNGVLRRLVDFAGTMPAVLFWPQDLDLVTDSPAIRRAYLNAVLNTVDRDYRRALATYEKATTIRNKLLRDKRELVYERRLGGGAIGRISEQIEYWGDMCIANGSLITRKRKEYIDCINKFQILNLKSQINSKLKIQSINFHAFYDKSEISSGRLAQYQEEEVLAGNTLVGPHRDDFIITKIQNSKQQASNKFKTSNSKLQTREKELAKYGSRGEQRLGVLWLKLAELAFVEQKLGMKPILLLDDILSELDEKHRELVMDIVGNQQTIITTTDAGNIKKKKFKKMQIIKI